MSICRFLYGCSMIFLLSTSISKRETKGIFSLISPITDFLKFLALHPLRCFPHHHLPPRLTLRHLRCWHCYDNHETATWRRFESSNFLPPGGKPQSSPRHRGEGWGESIGVTPIRDPWLAWYIPAYMGVSKNRGTSKWMAYNGKHY